jgi:eukaryotic-like serine/threonine-protein kinase
MNAPTGFRIGAWVVRPALNLIESSEQSIKLETRTMDVLVQLAMRAGEVLSVEELLASVWRGVVVGDSSVYQAIRQLRQALAGAGDDTSYIETIPKRGYRLVAPVTALTLPSAAAERSAAPDSLAPAAIPPRRREMKWFLAGAALVVAALAAAAWVRTSAPQITDTRVASATRFTIAVPDLGGNRKVAVSPDGRYLAYVAGKPVPRLHVRALGAFEARALPGTEGANMPFWSPESRELGFRSGSELKRVALVGGEPRVIADIGNAPAGVVTWNAAGDILFDGGTGIERVSANGGARKKVTMLAPDEGAHILPVFLPDGRRFFYSQGFKRPLNIYVQALDSAQRVLVASGAALATYASGYLLLNSMDGTLTAQRFDIDSLKSSGEVVRLAEDSGGFSVSANGVLAYAIGRPTPQAPPRQLTQLAWYDRKGRRLGTVGKPGWYRGIALSPDGRHVAVHQHEGADAGDIWVLELDNEARAVRRTFNRAHNMEPVWSPDGSRIAYVGAGFNLYQTNSTGDSPERLLLDSLRFAFVSDWSPDGKTVLLSYVPASANQADFAAVDIDTGTVSPIVATRFNEGEAKFSPDGHFITYMSDASGSYEIYARPYGSAGEPVRISTHGGMAPRWAHDGSEIFYLTENGTLMSVPVTVNSQGIVARNARPLFKASFAVGDHGSPIGDLYHVTYDVSADGQRFLVNERIGSAPAPGSEAELGGTIAVVVDWTADVITPPGQGFVRH